MEVKTHLCTFRSREDDFIGSKFRRGRQRVSRQLHVTVNYGYRLGTNLRANKLVNFFFLGSKALARVAQIMVSSYQR